MAPSLLLTLKAIGSKASGQSEALSEVLSQMLVLEPKPLKRFVLRFGFMEKIDNLSRADRALLATLPKPICLRLLCMYFYNGARLYRNESHRCNLFRPQFELIASKYGADIATPDMRRLCPWIGR